MNDWIWTLIILVVYLLFGALGKRKPKRKPVAQAGPIPKQAPNFEDTLRELRNALGMDGPPVEKEMKPAPELARTPTRSHGPSLADTAPKKSWSSEFIEHPPHYADARFEESPRRMPFVTSPTISKEPGIAPPQRAPSDLQAHVRSQLRDPDAARKAFVVSEIFGAPVAMRRR